MPSTFLRVNSMPSVLAANKVYLVRSVLFPNIGYRVTAYGTRIVSAVRVAFVLFNYDINLIEEELPSSFDYKYISASYDSIAGDKLLCDTTSGSFTVKLPSGPSNGQVVHVVDYSGSFESNNLIIDRNGSTIDSQSENVTIDINYKSVAFIYNTSLTTWEVFA